MVLAIVEPEHPILASLTDLGAEHLTRILSQFKAIADTHIGILVLKADRINKYKAIEPLPKKILRHDITVHILILVHLAQIPNPLLIGGRHIRLHLSILLVVGVIAED
jgi:hypothetical protein